jgi:hypothetical protein
VPTYLLLKSKFGNELYEGSRRTKLSGLPNLDLALFRLENLHQVFGFWFWLVTCHLSLNGRYRQRPAMSHIARCLPHSATHPDHLLQNGQLVVRRVGFALVAVARRRAQPPHKIFEFSYICFCNPLNVCI